MWRPFLAFVVAALGCATPKFPAVPGDTEIKVSGVAIEARTGEHLDVSYKPLFEYLGLRKHSVIRPGRDFNEYRVAEDRRRIEAYLNQHGRFDAEVDEPVLVYSNDKRSVAVTWHVHEGVPYRIGSVEIVGAPPEHEALMRSMIPMKTGDGIDLEIYRPVRRAMAERLQDEGYGHARGYSRTFVDRETKTVAWFYYLDPGPKTKIGSIEVVGTHAVPAEQILARAGLDKDHPYSTTEKRRAELALLDTGAFASAVVLTDADIQTGPPEWPDTGGALAPEQVDADGKLVPRHLSETLAVKVMIVEAPSKQLRLELGVEGDPDRIDSFAGARLLLRNLIVPQQHVVLEGHVGYGVLFDDDEPANGIYGSALAQYLIPTTSGIDLRMTGRWRDVLYPAALLREVVAGPGVRTTFAPGVYADADAFYRFGRQLDMPMLVPAEDLALPMDDDSQGGELQLSIVADRRRDRIEPTDGWFLAARTSGALGDHRWLSLGADARLYLPLSKSWSIGLRGSGSVVTLVGDEGLPLGPRLFGGGNHGMRGYSRDHLSPVACDAMGECDPVGGRSLVESSAELRLLPFRALYGAALFVDAGASGATTKLDDGISVATGVGARIRSWYVPIGLDFSYAIVRKDEVAREWDRFLVFFRIGEAF